LQTGEFIYEQSSVGDIEYTFKHKKKLHERAVVAMESLYGERLDDHVSDLAHHYGRSDNMTKAVEYLGRAGQQAMRRSAYAEAISSLSAATNLVQEFSLARGSYVTG
jgi:predicted ATPase